MKRCHRNGTVRAEHGLPVDGGEHADIVTDRVDDWRANEDPVERLIESRDIELSLEGIDLAAVPVAARHDRNGRQTVLVGTAVLDPFRAQNQAGTGTEDRHPVGHPPTKRIEHVALHEQHRHRGRLTARNDERVDRCQLIVGLDLARFDTEIPKDREVRSEGALERQDTDRDRAGHQPRSASLVSSVAISRPFMASPRPVDTFARIWGSW